MNTREGGPNEKTVAQSAAGDKPERTLAELNLAELLTSADSELSYANRIASGKEMRTLTLGDGKEVDNLIAAIASARARLIVARMKIDG